MRNRILMTMVIIVIVGIAIQGIIGIIAGIIVASIVGIVYALIKKDKLMKKWSVVVFQFLYCYHFCLLFLFRRLYYPAVFSYNLMRHLGFASFRISALS